MTTIKELKAELFKQGRQCGRITWSTIQMINHQLKTLKDVLGLIDEMQKRGDLSPIGMTRFEALSKLKAKIEG